MSGLFIGLMSGTSMDGVDGVLARFAGAGASVEVLGHAHESFPESAVQELLALNSPGGNELHRAALAANALARSYAQTVHSLLAAAGLQPHQVVAIGAHGQTVRHRPGEFDGVGYTLQINAPALVAELTGISVVADFRSRDVAAGGQGAPLVPAFHRAVFGRRDAIVGVLNLGGISNLTVLGPENSTTGFDCGPGNVLLNHWCQAHTGRPFDDGGAWAASGHVDEALLATLLSEPYFSRVPPKSTGRDLFNAQWLSARLAPLTGAQSLRAEDVQATLAELTASVCAASARAHAPGMAELLICGGGAFNTHVLHQLSKMLPGVDVATTDTRGLPAVQVEACAFAWLAHAWFEHTCTSIASVTGARGPRVLGALYPAG